jgi:hypothetical protein
MDEVTCQSTALKFAIFSSNAYPGFDKEVAMKCNVVTHLNLTLLQKGRKEI